MWPPSRVSELRHGREQGSNIYCNFESDTLLIPYEKRWLRGGGLPSRPLGLTGLEKVKSVLLITNSWSLQQPFHDVIKLKDYLYLDMESFPNLHSILGWDTGCHVGEGKIKALNIALESHIPQVFGASQRSHDLHEDINARRKKSGLSHISRMEMVQIVRKAG